MKRIVVALAACAVAVFAQGAAADQTALERARIRDERAQAQRLYEERERTCHERFAVTGCLDAARAQRREALDRLRHEELVLDSAERKQRAAARAMRIREKQIAQESKPTPLVVRERQAAPRKPVPKAAPERVSGADAAASATPRLSEEQARRNKAAFDAKQKEAAEHRADVEQRNAARSQKTRSKAALPLPQGASAP
jgi:colicin import membrane protein